MTRGYLITGFADEIAGDLTTQIEHLKKLNMHYIEMRGVDGNNLIYHSDEKVKEIKARLDASGIALSALGSPLGKIGKPMDICKCAKWLIEDEFTTGQIISVNGGYTI